MKKELSLILPVYNEEEGLVKSFNQIYHFLQANNFTFEIIIVDDASTDRSLAIARSLASQYSNVVLRQHEKNQGPCSGFKTGIRVAQYDWILQVPVDLAIPLTDINVLWQARENCDIALGYLKKPSERSMLRRTLSRGYTILINFLFATEFKQINYVALYRKSIFRDFQLVCAGGSIHAEVLIRSHRTGKRILNVGLGYEPRRFGIASGAKPKVIFKTLWDIFRLRFLKY